MSSVRTCTIIFALVATKTKTLNTGWSVTPETIRTCSCRRSYSCSILMILMDCLFSVSPVLAWCTVKIVPSGECTEAFSLSAFTNLTMSNARISTEIDKLPTTSNHTCVPFIQSWRVGRLFQWLRRSNWSHHIVNWWYRDVSTANYRDREVLWAADWVKC